MSHDHDVIAELKLAAGAAVLLAVGYYHFSAVRDARAEGLAAARAECAAAEAEAARQANADRTRNAERAIEASTEHEKWRTAVLGQLLENRNAMRAALNRPPLSCPATVGDLIVPAAALERLRYRADGQVDPSFQRSPSGESGDAVRRGPADSDDRHATRGRVGSVAGEGSRSSAVPRSPPSNH